MNCVAILVCFLGAVLYLPVDVLAYENLALKKPTWQSSTWRYCYKGCGADQAVDGRTSNVSVLEGQCALSDSERTAEWRVDLGGVLSIHHIFIQYVARNWSWEDFLGFSVYVSNTTNKDEGVLCFRDTTYTRATIPNPVNITCRHQGRYVIYYNNRTHPPYPDGYSSYAWVNLCEVEVYGCSTPGFCGGNRSLECPQNCQEGRCDIVKGTCLGCVPGYTGSRCNEKCDRRTFGQDCGGSCGECLRGEQCHHVNGTCMTGCDQGYQGITCTEECGNNTYGMDCKETCGNCSNGEQCHHVDGSCPFGCNAGIYGAKCDKECPTGRYGKNCAERCAPNCQGCNRFNGVCEFGFLTGWTGLLCERTRVGSSHIPFYVVIAILVVFLSTAFVVIVYLRRQIPLHRENENAQSGMQAPGSIELENYDTLAIPEESNNYTTLTTQHEEDPAYEEMPK